MNLRLLLIIRYFNILIS